MGVDPEQLDKTLMLALDRPFANGEIGQWARDPYTGYLYNWNENKSYWESVGATTDEKTLYVDGIAGDDGDAGDVSNPLASIQEAINRVPPHVRDKVTIDVQDDGGSELVYDESIVIRNKILEANIEVIGKDVLASPTTGPNTVAPGAHTGDFRSITISPDPGWTPDDLIGYMINFTAGPHVGTTAWVLDNTSDTIIFSVRPWPYEGVYGAADGFEIREITTKIKQDTNLFDYPSIYVNDVSGDNQEFVALYFNKMHVIGDKDLNFSIGFSGISDVIFEECRLDDYIYGGFGKGHGNIAFDQCLLHTTASGSPAGSLFNSSPGWSGSLSVRDTGILGGICTRVYGFQTSEALRSTP
jgi:hypothetical protein